MPESTHSQRERRTGAGASSPSLAPREDFPILAREIHGKPLVFLDSAASSQKPRQVLEAMDAFARTSYANIHRGVYTLSEEATARIEGAQEGRALHQRAHAYAR